MEMTGEVSQARSTTGGVARFSSSDGDLKLSANTLKVLEKRYLAKDEQGRVIESPAEMFARVARNVAQAETAYGGQAEVKMAFEEFYGVLTRLEFLPNSPTLMNAGRELQQLSACFVLPVGDSMEEIFETVKQAAIIHKTGGGTGFSFSRLRPKADVVRTTGGVASGPVSFMKVFNHATEAVKQGGTRRGANMGILRVDHPDILEFITCKTDNREITNFNISVTVTDAFMEALARDESFDLINPRNGQKVRSYRAREVMDKIAYQAWKNGEPGLFFIDVTNRTNPTPHVAAIEATNPCGEQPLLPYESCNLGSINLEKHLMRSASGGNGRYEVNWDHLQRTIRVSVKFLDDVIDMNRYPLPQIEEITKANRKIGLGVMGFARMLFKLSIPYDSEEGVEMGRKVMKFIRDIGYDESMRLAQQRGVYRHWKGSLHEKRGQPVRNSYVTTVAPTGTLSMIADTSGGCEPEFSLIWYKNVMDGEHLPYVLDYFIDVAKAEGFWREDLLDRILDNHGSVKGLDQVPAHWQRVFVTSHDINTDWHIKMQAAFQEFSDSAVSKTINLPKDATVEDVKKAYLLAYQLGCKGITVYRDGSREEQVMNLGVSKKELKTGAEQTQKTVGDTGFAKVKPRPYKRAGVTLSRETPFGTAHITMNHDEEGPAEVFITIGKAGSDVMAMAEGYGRSISLYLRMPSPLSRREKVRELVDQLRGIGGARSIGFGEARVSSLPDAIARALAEHWLSDTETPVQKPLTGSLADPPKARGNGGNGGNTSVILTGNLCPECGMLLAREEGCQKCYFCGYSEC
jgi:ribonucleoside-diphosphate reductase alpha chain